MQPYIEIAVYQLGANVKAEEFLALADENLADFQRVPGFIKRELSVSEDGQYLDMVYYDSRASAEAAEAILTAAPSIQKVMALLDFDRGLWFHASPLRRYPTGN